MKIYGVAILAGCFIAGQFIGEALGYVLNIDANVGGVGFAMVLLIVVNLWLHKIDRFPKESQEGIGFWSDMYLPVIVAMSATQDVAAALSGSTVAIIAGVMVTVIPLMILPMISKLARKHEPAN